MINIAVNNDTYNNAVAYAKRHNTTIPTIVENYLRNIDQQSLEGSEGAMSPWQKQLWNMASHVKSKQEIDDIRRIIGQYYAKKAEEEMDELWDKGVINDTVIEGWKSEHMRTPYKK